MTEFRRTGGCQCGAVRYSIHAPATVTEHCHCSMCRKIHGTVMVTFSHVAKDKFVLEKGKENLSVFDSSPPVHRHFCKTCGCQLFALDDDHPEIVEVATGTFDGGAHPGHPESSLRHIYFKSKVPWLEVKDELPKLDTV